MFIGQGKSTIRLIDIIRMWFARERDLTGILSGGCDILAANHGLSPRSTAIPADIYWRPGAESVRAARLATFQHNLNGKVLPPYMTVPCRFADLTSTPY